MARAVIWAMVPILAAAAMLGVAVGPERTDLVASLIDQAMIGVVLGILVADAAYRSPCWTHTDLRRMRRWDRPLAGS